MEDKLYISQSNSFYVGDKSGDDILDVSEANINLKHLLGRYTHPLVYILGFLDISDANIKNHFKEIKPLYVGFAKSTDALNSIKERFGFYKDDKNVNGINLISCESEREAFVLASEIWHDYQSQIYNDYHPTRLLDIGWKCTRCDYKPSKN